jgi:hypothetical protein
VLRHFDVSRIDRTYSSSSIHFHANGTSKW